MASSPPDAADDAHLHDWPAVYALSAGWALSFSVVTASITATNLASSAFSPSASWNTVPLAFLIVSLSAWSLALPSLFARLGGRLNTYRATSCVGVVTSAIAAAACATESFGALCVSSALFGYPRRPARASGSRCSRWSPRSRPKCIGLVLTGGIVGAVLGPAYAAAAKDLFQSAPFAGVYLCTGVAPRLLGVVCAPGLVTFPSEGGDADADRAPAFAAVRAPTVTSSGTSAAVGMATADVGFRCAVAVASLSYGAMSFLMSPTPLSMRARGFSFDTIAHVTRAAARLHAPSFRPKAVAKRGWRPVAVAAPRSSSPPARRCAMGAPSRTRRRPTHFGRRQEPVLVAATAEVEGCPRTCPPRCGSAAERAKSAQNVRRRRGHAAVAGAASVSAARRSPPPGSNASAGRACAGRRFARWFRRSRRSTEWMKPSTVKGLDQGGRYPGVDAFVITYL